jgi:hypothetical protein
MPAGTRDIVAVVLKGEVTPQATVNVGLVTTSQCLNLGSRQSVVVESNIVVLDPYKCD